MNSEDIFNNTCMSEASSCDGQINHLRIVKRSFDVQHNASIPYKKRISIEGLTSSTPFKNKNSACNVENNINEEVLSFLKKLEQRLGRVETILNDMNRKMIDRNEFMAQNKMIRECKVVLRRVHKSVGLMTGEEECDELNEIATTLPLTTIDAALEVEQKLKNQEYAQAMKTYVHRLKGASEDVDAVLRRMFADELLYFFNWDGRCDKKALGKMSMIDDILSDVFKAVGRFNFERQIKKSIEKSHNRLKQKKRAQLKGSK